MITSKKEVVELVQAISEHVDKRAFNVLAPHKTDFGDVLGQDSAGNWLIRIRGKPTVVLPASAFYFAQFYLPDTGWLDIVPEDQLAAGDRLALTCTDGDYTIVGRAVLGG